MTRTSVDLPSVVVPGQKVAVETDDREEEITQEASAAVATEPSPDEKTRRSVRTPVPDPPGSAKPAARQPSRRGMGAGAAAPGLLGAPPMIPLAAPVSAGAPQPAAPDPDEWADSVPFADPSLQALQNISSQFGSGTAAVPDGSLASLSNGFDASQAIRWGLAGANYQSQAGAMTRQADALAHLDSELGQVLSDTADMANGGRAQINAIIADVNAALTALGPIRNTAEGRAMVHDTLTTALDRAGIALANAQSAASATAQEVSALVDQYVNDYGEKPVYTPSPDAGYSQGGSSGGPPAQVPSGEVGQWIDQALQTLAQNGHDVSAINPAAVASIIAHESGGNPNAINLWDSNAAAGIPSKGLMQTIDPTFNAYAVPGHQDVWNPVDNIMAGIRYAEERYGSVDNVPGIVAMRSGGGYVGY
ncbi:transglycosylase SLT domain-containing protein [Micromonospora sp. WMMD736]|uniref:transglycosylase SLT domain-containing protein n=1 Tax=Micromonospora sp. WMMD736 TaxID=3404112 RepID=UPI003B93945B